MEQTGSGRTAEENCPKGTIETGPARMSTPETEGRRDGSGKKMGWQKDVSLKHVFGPLNPWNPVLRSKPTNTAGPKLPHTPGSEKPPAKTLTKNRFPLFFFFFPIARVAQR
jgi:hypothetical protein